MDTSAWYAYIVPADEAHAHAAHVIKQAAEAGAEILTTNAVVAETYALLLNRPEAGRDRAVAFLDMIEGEEVTVVRVTEEDETQAIALVRAHTDKGYSLVDAQSFVIMERLGATHALAFDRHFRAYGKLQLA